MTALDVYPLTRDASEHIRLAGQAAFWQPDAAALFDAAGVGPGDRAADLGCGTAHIAEWLAARVGPTGHVRAVDNDARLIAAFARAARCPWLNAEVGDAYATGWPGGSLDAVHARFLAAPAGRLDTLITEMRRLVRPGGLVMLQEPIADSWSLPAAGAAWERALSLIRAGFKRRGGDFDAGQALETSLRAAGGTDVHARRVVRTLPPRHPYARLPLAFCDSLAALWRSTGMAADDEVERMRAQITQALDHETASTTTFTLVQAWCRF